MAQEEKTGVSHEHGFVLLYAERISYLLEHNFQGEFLHKPEYLGRSTCIDYP